MSEAFPVKCLPPFQETPLPASVTLGSTPPPIMEQDPRTPPSSGALPPGPCGWCPRACSPVVSGPWELTLRPHFSRVLGSPCSHVHMCAHSASPKDPAFTAQRLSSPWALLLPIITHMLPDLAQSPLASERWSLRWAFLKETSTPRASSWITRFISFILFLVLLHGSNRVLFIR